MRTPLRILSSCRLPKNIAIIILLKINKRVHTIVKEISYHDTKHCCNTNFCTYFHAAFLTKRVVRLILKKCSFISKKDLQIREVREEFLSIPNLSLFLYFLPYTSARSGTPILLKIHEYFINLIECIKRKWQFISLFGYFKSSSYNSLKVYCQRRQRFHVSNENSCLNENQFLTSLCNLDSQIS